MLKQYVSAILLSIVIVGCSERYGGPINPVPHIPDERPAVPSEDQVIEDLEASHGDYLSSEIVSEVHSVDARVYIVAVDNDTQTPVFFKVTYYFIDDAWVCIPEAIEM